MTGDGGSSQTGRMTVECPECGHEWDPIRKNAEIPDMVTTVLVARKFGIRPRTVRRWIESGRLPAVKVKSANTFRYHVRVEDVLRLIES